jgi:hypothetical protein
LDFFAVFFFSHAGRLSVDTGAAGADGLPRRATRSAGAAPPDRSLEFPWGPPVEVVNRREALAAIAFVWFAASTSVDQQELQVRFACELQGVCTSCQIASAGPCCSKWRRALLPKKKQTQIRKAYTRDDLKALKQYSKARTPISNVAKTMKRSVPALRAKAHQLGIGLGEAHRG